MKKIDYAVIGGGASGLILANALAKQLKNQGKSARIVLFERLDRVGKKLSATGNGQGNITNLEALGTEYFTFSKKQPLIQKILSAFGPQSLREYFLSLGVPLCADERGRVYPASRQASALTDALRFAIGEQGVELCLGAKVTRLQKAEEEFQITVETQSGAQVYAAKKVALCTGGKAAKNFGTDGSAYSLAQAFGHTVTPLYPSLVQLKTDTAYTKSLKGIRVAGGKLTAYTPTGSHTFQGDIIFTDYGISGDAVFRASAYLADQIESGKVRFSIDFLPEISGEEIVGILKNKQSAFPTLEKNELLFGVVNNQVGRAIFKRANGDMQKAAQLVKDFSLQVTGSLGFDYAQVTKGGIRLDEVTDGLESRLVDGLYFAGEGLDVDGPCGGFNLQWAYSSARAVAAEIAKDRGQV
ncbi:MAG: aminoacetone oxidase family FAD-binding enzyme [Clostridia bacterium]|nr:aminoacetone oxidase family FAD-binding enzyme [Clostridia bacterium]